MRGKWFLISAAVVLAAAAAAGILSLRRRAAAPVPAPADRPARFAGAEITLPGSIRAQQVILVAAPIEGTLETLLVESGQSVYEGQLLGRVKNTGLESEQQAATEDLESLQSRLADLDNELIAVRLEASRARADADRAQSEADRTERLYQREQMLLREGATPRLRFEKAEADFRAAGTERDTRAALACTAETRLTALTARLDALRKQLEDKTEALDDANENVAAAEIHSPVSGLVLACTRRAGDEVTPEVNDLFRIAVNLSALEAVVEPPPPALARIRPGQEAVILLADVPDAIPARVKQIDGNQVVVEFTSPSPAIRPGLSAQVRIKLIP